MKRLKLILICVLMLGCLYCGNGDAGKDAEKKETVNKPLQDPADPKIVLIIEGKKFTNKQLKEFIKSRYPGMESIG